jgi:hypothetical protein
MDCCAQIGRIEEPERRSASTWPGVANPVRSPKPKLGSRPRTVGSVITPSSPILLLFILSQRRLDYEPHDPRRDIVAVTALRFDGNEQVVPIPDRGELGVRCEFEVVLVVVDAAPVIGFSKLRSQRAPPD